MNQVYKAFVNCFKSLFEYIVTTNDKEMAEKVLAFSQKITEYLERFLKDNEDK